MVPLDFFSVFIDLNLCFLSSSPPFSPPLGPVAPPFFYSIYGDIKGKMYLFEKMLSRACYQPEIGLNQLVQILKIVQPIATPTPKMTAL